VSNADPFQTFYRLVGEEHTPRAILKKLEKMVPSDSLAGVYLGLDVDISHFGIKDYEIFYNTSWDHEAMHRAMLEGRFREGMVSMTFYSNLGDDFYAPAGRGAMVLHAYSSFDYWSRDPQVYERQKHEMMNALIDVAQKVMPGLREHIVYSEGMTPRTIQSYTMNYKGSPYGMSFTVDQRSRMDIETDIAGLYLAGSWAFPAHSVAMAQVSGYLASQLILKRDGR